MKDTTYARLAGLDDVLRAAGYSEADWRTLQESYRMGELLMPCCDAAAVPKTSPLGLQFFAHASGQCGGAPESIWHLQAKEAVAEALRQLGHSPTIEQRGKGWQADVFFEVQEQGFVVECQHSYQHLRDYISRQQRYAKVGLQCLWLVMDDKYGTMQLSAAKHRQRTDLKGIKEWPLGDGGLVPDFPVAALRFEPQQLAYGPSLAVDLPGLLAAFVQSRFVWDRGNWLIADRTQTPLFPGW